jgi:hypothetical protein
MADNDDGDEDLVIDLDAPEDEKTAQTPAGQTAKPPPVPGPGDASRSANREERSPPPPQTGGKDLENQLSAERAAKSRLAEENRRVAAERDQAILFAQEAERRGMSVYELNNENQLKAAEEQLETLTAQQEAAMEGGDFKLAADLNRKMHRLGGQLALLERDKVALAQQKGQMQQRQQRPPQTRQPAEPEPANALERALQGRTEPTKNFLRKHPDLVRSDGSLKRTAIDAHERALDDGHAVDSQGYFDYIEKIIGGQGGQAMSNGQGEAGDRAVAPPRQRAPTMAAPPERGSPPGGDNLAAGEFRMTPKMRRLAEEQGVSPKEWAQNYVRLLREGRITPIT